MRPCDATCVTCQNTTTECTACPTGKLLHNGQCLDACPAGYDENDADGACAITVIVNCNGTCNAAALSNKACDDDCNVAACNYDGDWCK